MRDIGAEKIYPPAAIGIIGGGQLGRMISYEAKRLGYKVVVLDPTPDSPAGQVSDKQIVAAYDDMKAIRQLAEETKVITYEFEHIDAEVLETVEAEGYRVYPSSKSLRIIQNKYRQKSFLQQAGLPVPSFFKLSSADKLSRMEELKYPCIIKTCCGGYDGKGNHVINKKEDLTNLPSSFLKREVIIEEYIDFERELSILAARSKDGKIIYYPVVENIHKDSILRTTKVPAQIDKDLEQRVCSIAMAVMRAFDDIGIFCIELFQTKDNKIFINEIAPRPHNSGHYTIEGCITSQYEQLVRAITGLPLGSPRLLSPCAMVNILGDNSAAGEYTFLGLEAAMQSEAAYVHLYGKKTTAYLRKIGHITVLDENAEKAAKRAEAVLDSLCIKCLEG